MFNKRGISAIVATVMIILITVAAIGILWAAIIPMIQTNLDFSSLQGRVSVLDTGYTTYDSDKEITSVQIKRDVDEGVMDRVKISFEVGGNSYSSNVVAPPSGGIRVYYFDMTGIGEPDFVSVAPIFSVGNKEKEGEITSSVSVPKSRISGSVGVTFEIGEEYFGDGSCLEILNFGENTGSGVYTIDPDGKIGDRAPFEAYCDMTTDGGGWTIITNNDNSDTEESGCFPRVSGYEDDFCGDISYGEDFVVDASGVSFSEMVWAAYEGNFDITSYQYFVWESSQNIPSTNVWSLQADSYNQILKDYSALPIIKCTHAGYDDLQYVRLQTTQGNPIVSRNTVFSSAATSKELSFTDAGGASATVSRTGLDDWQDGHGCGDAWEPKSNRGYSSFVMIR